MSILKYISNCVLLFSTAYALPTAGTTRASYYSPVGGHEHDFCDSCFKWEDAITYRTGYYGDFIFNRDLERRENEHNVGNIETTRIITNAGIVVLNVIDWFEFFAVLGTTTVTIETPSYTGDFDSLLEFSPRFSWSLGVSAVVWRYGDFLWGWRGQYFRTQPKPNSYYDLGGGVATYFNDVKTATYYDWTVATGISYEFQTSENTQLIPHISLTAAGAKLGMRGLSFTNNGVFHKILNMKTKKMWGYGLGATFGLGHRIAMTIEGRFADGCAMFVGGEFKL